jgi:hypothetical protein
MGMDRKLTFTPAAELAWPRLADFFAQRQFPVTLMMIDGSLSFPDEQPPHDWRELRVGTPLGMVTLRRESDGIRLVTWGNADETLRQAWNAVSWGLAEVFGGVIDEGAAGPLSAAEFAQRVELPTGFSKD